MLIKVCDYIKELLTYDSSKIVAGRTNLTIDDFTQDFIIVDILTLSPIYRNEDYSGTTEIMKYYTTTKANITVDFFGTNALTHAMNFLNLQSSQKATELQATLGVGLFHTTNIKNLMEKVGTTYFNRYQIELVLLSSNSSDVSTLRIDTVVADIKTDVIKKIGVIEITSN